MRSAVLEALEGTPTRKYCTQPGLLIEGIRRCGLVRLSRAKDIDGWLKRISWECLTSRLSSWPRRSTGRTSLDVVVDAFFAISSFSAEGQSVSLDTQLILSFDTRLGRSRAALDTINIYQF